MNAVMRIVEYPKGGGVKELSIFSIDEFNVDYKAKTVWYRNCMCEQVHNPDHIRVDCSKSPVIITAVYEADHIQDIQHNKQDVKTTFTPDGQVLYG